MGSGWRIDVGVGILCTSHTTIARSTMIASCPGLERERGIRFPSFIQPTLER